MANNDPKPVLGYRHCPDCGTRGTIHQAGGRRGTLYQRCECGCVQSSGRLIQSRMWYETEWLPGLKPDAPPKNIYTQADYDAELEKARQRHGATAGQADQPDRATPAAQAVEETEPEGDFDPTAEPAAPPAKKTRKGVKWRSIALVALGGIGVFILKVVKASRAAA